MLDPLRAELTTLKATLTPDATNGETTTAKSDDDGLPEGWSKADPNPNPNPNPNPKP